MSLSDTLDRVKALADHRMDELHRKENEISRLMTENLQLRRVLDCRTFDPCPYNQDGCLLEDREVGPCLCANPPRSMLPMKEDI
jgi:hypothetical protein